MNSHEIVKQLLLKNYPTKFTQRGDGKLTRIKPAADNITSNADNITSNANKSPEIVKKRNRKDVERFAKRQKMRDMAKSPIPSTSTNPPPAPYPPSPNWSSGDEKNISELTDYEENDGSEVQLFDTVTKIYENEDLEVYVVKTMFKRQKIFRVQDHNYCLKIKLKKQKKKKAQHYLLNSLLDVLNYAFTYIINNLKLFYDEEDTNLIYLTIYQNGMSRSINSGSYVLQSITTASMVESVLNMFERFVNSDSTIDIFDNSFQCYFKVLSMDHVNYSKHRRKAIPQTNYSSSHVGCRTGRYYAVNSEEGLLDLPDSFPDNPIAFVNKCLFTSFFFGYYQSRKFDPNINDPTYDELLYLTDRKKSKRRLKNEAGVKLLNLIDKCAHKLNISPCGPHDYREILPKLAIEYQCQIHVIIGSQEKNSNVESFPNQYDDSLAQIFLLRTSKNHVVFINNLRAFFRHNREICLVCHKTFGHHYRHKCVRETCNKCLLFFATEKTMQPKYLPFQFCNSRISSNLDENVKCKLCLVTFDTKKCFDLHTSLCGKISKTGEYKRKISRRGQLCQICNKYLRFKVAGMTPKQIIENHVCFEEETKKCQHCRGPKFDRLHSCKVEKTPLTKNWPNLVFINFEYRNLSSEHCEACEQIRKKNTKAKNELPQNIFCEYHEKNYVTEEPNVICIWREKRRGIFEEHIILEDSFDEPSFEPDEKYTFEYFSDKNVQPYTTEVKARYNHTWKFAPHLQNVVLQKSKEKNNSAIWKFLQLILLPEWRNSVFLSWNEGHNHLVSFLCLNTTTILPTPASNFV